MFRKLFLKVVVALTVAFSAMVFVVPIKANAGELYFGIFGGDPLATNALSPDNYQFGFGGEWGDWYSFPCSCIGSRGVIESFDARNSTLSEGSLDLLTLRIPVRPVYPYVALGATYEFAPYGRIGTDTAIGLDWQAFNFQSLDPTLEKSVMFNLFAQWEYLDFGGFPGIPWHTQFLSAIEYGIVFSW